MHLSQIIDKPGLVVGVVSDQRDVVRQKQFSTHSERGTAILIKKNQIDKLFFNYEDLGRTLFDFLS